VLIINKNMTINLLNI